MQVNHEKEFHTLINKELYTKLISTYHFDRELNITNVYFSLLNKNYMLRMRSTNDKEFELTLKITSEKENIEHNQSLTKEEYLAIKKDPSLINGDILKDLKNIQFNIKNLKIIGELHCFRLEKDFNDHLLVLDKNEYNGVVDYDIEIESNDKDFSKQLIIKIFNEHNYTCPLNIDSKSKRFINTLNKD